MSFVQQNKYVPQYVPHGPHWLIFVNKISNLKGLNGGALRPVRLCLTTREG